MASNPVGWFEIYVQDMARAQAFYENMLQTKLDKLPGTDFDMVAFPSAMASYGAAGALVKMEGVPSGGNSTLQNVCSIDCTLVPML